ncbi:MAG: DUF6868 family protein [Maioricimonas sp. JB049]
MDVPALRSFFLWCSVANICVIAVCVLLFLTVPDRIYEKTKRYFRISRRQFDTFVYAYLGMYKILVIVFNILPYVTLVIVDW